MNPSLGRFEAIPMEERLHSREDGGEWTRQLLPWKATSTLNKVKGLA